MRHVTSNRAPASLPALLALPLLVLAMLLTPATPARADPFTPLPQGPKWTAATRDAFYTIDQGSRLIPYRWALALRQPDGAPFLADGLARYGYLENPNSPTKGLPIGFMVAPEAGIPTLGMNCSACHTRQIDTNNRTYRIDGGPALADFQALLADLDAAMATTLATPATFASFATAVFAGQPAPTPAQIATLRAAVEAWYAPFHTIIAKSLPTATPWGIGRLDAISMIFNRVAGLDLGPASSGGMIPGNIVTADAPARYPFLWNASIQDRTQWPGFAPNGSPIFALTRNTGEVLGVFAKFHPTKTVFAVDYKTNSSIQLPGLWQLEDLIVRIGPPAFPGPVDQALARKGAELFAAAGPGCVACHGIAPGGLRPPALETWKTPGQDVGTDSREWQVLARKVDPGVLAGARIPLSFPPQHLPAADAPAADVLKVAVLGAIIDQLPTLLGGKADLSALHPDLPATPPGIADLLNWFRDPLDAPTPPPSGSFPYESRVLQGIWATAPYLHNGSVPTLADLLKPAAERPASFTVGRAYDLDRLGLATTQPAGPRSTITTTGCEARASGNSRCGHEFGTTLNPDEKAALLEYLKTL